MERQTATKEKEPRIKRIARISQKKRANLRAVRNLCEKTRNQTICNASQRDWERVESKSAIENLVTL